jgi:nicotinamide-nucleotide amidase
MFSPRTRFLVESLHAALAARGGLTIAAAESCTGGLISAALTDPPGSSAHVRAGFVVYANSAKTTLLRVPSELIAAHGAVSAPVASAMAFGCLEAAAADLAVAVTGIAGPTGGSPEKPVGLVFIAAAHRNGLSDVEEHRFGPLSRTEIRAQSIDAALALALRLLK